MGPCARERVSVQGSKEARGMGNEVRERISPSQDMVGLGKGKEAGIGPGVCIDHEALGSVSPYRYRAGGFYIVCATFHYSVCIQLTGITEHSHTTMYNASAQ